MSRAIKAIEERGDIATTKAITEEIGEVSREVVATTLQVMKSRRGPSIYDSLHEDGGGRLVDRIEDESTTPVEVMIDMKKFATELEKFGETLDSKRDKVIWKERIFSDDPRSLADIGRQFKVSNSRIGQVENIIKNKFNKWVKLSVRFA
jgi:DNA-directed RNA polymerase sigma subunit (sigma70/sigma32)